MTSRWLVPFVRASSPAFAVICFPWAGGGAAGFYPFKAYVGDDVSLWSVALPGRQHRLSEAQETDLDRSVACIGQDLVQISERPLVLLGHSFGALMAFEVAHWLRDHGHDIVKLLCISSRRSPDMPSRLPHLAGGTNDQLIAWMRDLGGAQDELLDCEEMYEVVLPPLRDDLTSDAAYRPRLRTSLNIPIVGLAGRDDPLVAVADVNGWANWTTQTFELNVLPGGHFYLNEAWAGIIAQIRRSLEGHSFQAGQKMGA